MFNSVQDERFEFAALPMKGLSVQRFQSVLSAVLRKDAKPHQSPPEALPTLIKKVDDELQIAWSEIYIPLVPDTQGDFMSFGEVRKMAYSYMAKGQIHGTDIAHDGELREVYMVESFIARNGDPDFVPGAWVGGWHVPGAELWQQIKDGEINGVSIEAHARRVKQNVEVNVPSTVEGVTEFADDHVHDFTVRFGEDGTFLGGLATEGDTGHTHKIVRGTVTEEADSHTHRYTIMDQLFEAQGQEAA